MPRAWRLLYDGRERGRVDVLDHLAGLGDLRRRIAPGGVRHPLPAVVRAVPLEGLLEAGEPDSAWTKRTSGFRYGTGYVSSLEGARAKWNFLGRGVRLWSPRGPEWGDAQVVLDGKTVGDISLHADAEQASSVVWANESLPAGPHAVMIVRKDGAMPVDSVEFQP